MPLAKCNGRCTRYRAGVSRRGDQLVSTNRRARHDYLVLDTWECGIVLAGSEVKSMREGHANIRDAYARVEDGEVWLYGMHVPPYAFSRVDLDPVRKRKLLLHHKEILAMARGTEEKGLTLVPLRVYFKDGRAKVELALGRGKRAYDKRQALAEARRRPGSRTRAEGSSGLKDHYHGGVALTAHAPGATLTRGCVASISRIEAGEASRRRRIVAKEPAHTNKCTRGHKPRNRCLVPTSSASLPAQPLGRNRGAIQSGSPPGIARGPGGTSHSGWDRHSLPVRGGDPRSPRRLRSEKPRQGLGRRGFDSRHLHLFVQVRGTFCSVST